LHQTLNTNGTIAEKCASTDMAVNRPSQVLFASLIGTTIEFFDFYIYATAAVLVFPRLFFPFLRPSLGHSGLASDVRDCIFFARPFGSALFGHFGDRVGRKATLVAALLTMGISTVAIGALPHLCHDRCGSTTTPRPSAASARVWVLAVSGAGAVTARNRECAAREARLVWDVSANLALRSDSFYPEAYSWRSPNG